ncbi:DNA topoisomerase III [Catenovulum sediminis]|uniref:DNA topoisomerase n=1 Tax=Catenovulum sediminis TaxID=1740262 RepID=A0ABV1RF79_9ALTE|nr:DNA topoisomerase III [Catenovulum sediminis]
MQLYIAEKPSLARAIATVLPKPQKTQDGYIELPNGDCVSWCIGHLLENAAPENYDNKYKSWQLDHLPIVPQKWQLNAKSKTKKQLSILNRLIKRASHIVHAGDPDREGQLLVDEVIAHCQQHNSSPNKPVSRLLISDLNPSAVKQALNKLKDNQDFRQLSISALARSRADWLFGINLSRAYSIKAQQKGYQGVVSIGRVQTPLLGLIVKRDDEISAFESKPFYQVVAHLQSPAGEPFDAMWQPSEACQPHMDSDGRVLNKKLAEHVIAKINGQSATVLKTEGKQKKQAAPLPYNLSALQIDASKVLSLTAQQTLDTCQSLYEKHKLITYPRSDCRYLPKEHFTQAPQISQAIGQNASNLHNAVQNANLALRSKAWNDAKVSAHHAIIPTSKINKSQLSPTELQLYQLICRQYLMQFYGPWVYQDNRIELELGGGVFIAKQRDSVELGWKQLLPQRKETQNNASQQQEVIAKPPLPELKKGDICPCLAADLLEKMTQPPEHFTDASLLSAMTGISRFVKDSNIRKILKETDGLGTEATRASMIEVLLKRGFIRRQGKKLLATETGKDLIHKLPASLTLPDMTAQWEASLEAICQAQQNYQNFMQPIENALNHLVADCIQQHDFQLSQSQKAQNAQNAARSRFSKKRRRKKAA